MYRATLALEYREPCSLDVNTRTVLTYWETVVPVGCSKCQSQTEI